MGNSVRFTNNNSTNYYSSYDLNGKEYYIEYSYTPEKIRTQSPKL